MPPEQGYQELLKNYAQAIKTAREKQSNDPLKNFWGNSLLPKFEYIAGSPK